MASTFTEIIEKYNPYHDARGRFSSQNGSQSYSVPKTGTTNTKPAPGTIIVQPGGARQTAFERNYRLYEGTTEQIVKDLEATKNDQRTKYRLTEDEAKAMEDYTDDAYIPMNKHLRGGYHVDDDQKRRINLLKSAVDKSVLEEDVVLHRKIDLDAVRALTNPKGAAPTDDELQQLIGKNLSDQGFLSTTVRPEYLLGQSYGIKIKAASGAKALVIDGDSHYRSEAEVLLPPSSKLKISNIDIRKSKYGERLVTFECEYD